MKYIVHIKLLSRVPPEEMAKATAEIERRFRGQENNYIVLVTKEVVSINVYPELLYNIGLWWSRFKTWLRNLINHT